MWTKTMWKSAMWKKATWKSAMDEFVKRVVATVVAMAVAFAVAGAVVGAVVVPQRAYAGEAMGLTLKGPETGYGAAMGQSEGGGGGIQFGTPFGRTRTLPWVLTLVAVAGMGTGVGLHIVSTGKPEGEGGPFLAGAIAGYAVGAGFAAWAIVEFLRPMEGAGAGEVAVGEVRLRPILGANEVAVVVRY